VPSRTRQHDLTVQQHLDDANLLHCPFPSHQICQRRFPKQERERASREDTTRPDSIQQNVAQPDFAHPMVTQRLARTHTRRDTSQTLYPKFLTMPDVTQQVMVRE
jgi:hypothetical protein